MLAREVVGLLTFNQLLMNTPHALSARVFGRVMFFIVGRFLEGILRHVYILFGGSIS